MAREDRNLARPLPQFNIVTVDELLSQVLGYLVVMAEDDDAALDMTIRSDGVCVVSGCHGDQSGDFSSLSQSSM
ncbi:hypothetical protein ACT4MK_00440 (plasmid) [Bradyrhizobium barranii]|uniref:hypothetical protein n=1 Tax=Bradyrhizobium TaxID=374 RepID=UPI003F2128A8